MRKACLKALVLALAVAGWTTIPNQAQAQLVQNLIQFTSPWKYNSSGANLGTAWKEINYAETGWSTGPGLLGLEPDTPAVYTVHAPIQTALPVGSTIITYYFRTTFNFSGSPTTPGLVLYATNLVDDGCTVYLNGTRAGSVRLAANATSTTLATGGTEGALEVMQIQTSLLKSGANTIAVEVHQSSATSSDVMFGMRLVAITPQQVVITSQPQGTNVEAGSRVTFSVGITGGPANYQWQRNGVNIAGATSATYVITSAAAANAGTYRVIVSNGAGSVTSQNAILTVISDTTGPHVTDAVIDNGFGTNSVNVLFDERLSSASVLGQTNKFRLVPVANTNISIQITNVLYNSALGALLRVSTTDPNWNPTADHFLVINDIADSLGNNIAPYTRVPVSIQIRTNLTQMSDLWSYYASSFFDPTYPAIYNNTSPSTSWFGTNYVIDYNSGLWGIGSGILYFDPNTQGQLCAGDSFQTLISFQNDPTLFRRTFVMPAGFGTNGQFQLRYIVDDGMVLYLNGVEIYRYNMPTGPLTVNSKALTAPDPVTCSTNVSIPVTNLKAGTNVLAAAVYQNGPAPQSDTIFGLEMDGVFLSTPAMPIKDPAPTQLRLTYNWNKATRKLVLSWPTNFSGFSLVTKEEIGTSSSTPDWIQVQDQTNPYTNSVPTSGNRVFEIKKL